jgi:two-component system sensor histidine kinase RegB
VRTLMLTRWVAIAGQAGAVTVVHWLAGISLPLLPVLLTISVSVVLNLRLWLSRGPTDWHSGREAAAYLAFDILQLSALLYFTGGLENPFAVLLLVPVTISATILSLHSTVGLGVLAFAATSILAFYHVDLNWPSPGLQIPDIYVWGIWASIVTATAFLMFYAWRVAEEARRMSDALAATQLALSREQELSALGGLAAATVHELGTPLGTIALIGKELSRSSGFDDAAREDLTLMNSQVDRCREILARLARNPGAGIDRDLENMGFDVLLNHIAELHHEDGVAIKVLRAPEDGDGENLPMVRRRPEIVQGLSNLIENAVEFAQKEVEIVMHCSDQILQVTIMDDGPGFPDVVLDAIGDPYISTRPDRGRMGLGLFISKTLLERTGASIGFANRQGAPGAEVVIAWPRGIIEIERA